jgi:hypothetical protein
MIDKDANFSLEDTRKMIKEGASGKYTEMDVNALREFFKFMSICHTVAPEVTNG